MKKKLNKILLIAVMLVIICSITSAVLAGTELRDTNPFGHMNTVSIGAETQIKSSMSAIISVVQAVGTSAALIVIVILGIKYMGTSPSERAEIKTHATVYIVGAVLLFGAVGILEIVKVFGENLVQEAPAPIYEPGTSYIEQPKDLG